MNNFKKRTMAQVRASIKQRGSWTGIIAGNKTIVSNGQRVGYAEVTVSSLSDFEKLRNDFFCYLAPELGDRAIFYEGMARRQSFRVTSF